MSSGGKGSIPRPLSVDKKVYDARWDAIFKKPVVNTVPKPNKENYVRISSPIPSTKPR